MTDVVEVMDNIRLVRELSNELAAYLHTLPDDVWRYADRYQSGCEKWKMADVVAHLIWEGIDSFQSVSRAQKGDTSPPVGHRSIATQDNVDWVISLRLTYDEDLFPEFNVSCRRLNTLLASLRPEDYTMPVWHPRSPTPVSELINVRALELAAHSWDVRYGLDRAAKLSQTALPLLAVRIPDWLRDNFRASKRLDAPLRYRFEIDDSVDGDYDVIISGDDFDFKPANGESVDVTFRCDQDFYVLFGMGRMPFARSVRRGRLSFEGDEGLASGFIDWFKQARHRRFGD